MEDAFVRLFNEELTHVRRMADEFGGRHPEVARRLKLSQEPPDPYVQQLLDGFAFLAARVRLKLDAEFPHFIESLLQTVYPHYLAPLPSMAIVEFQPDWDNPELASGPSIAAQTELTSLLKMDCKYQTAHNVEILPIRLAAAHYYERDLEEIDSGWAKQTGARAAIRLTLEATAGLNFDQIPADRLVFHIPPREDLGGLLYGQIMAHCPAVVVQSSSHSMRKHTIIRNARSGGSHDPSLAAVRGMGFEEDEHLLPPRYRTFSGYRLLQEYFAFPSRFLFIEVSQLKHAFSQCANSKLDLIFCLDETDLRLNERVTADCFKLYCAPAINLFPLENITIGLSEEEDEYLVVPDRMNNMEYEVYSIEKVVGRFKGESGPDERCRFQPFHFASATENSASGFFNVRRVPRQLSDAEISRGIKPKFPGTDLYLSLVTNADHASDGRFNALHIKALCSNRRLPQNSGGQIEFSRDFGVPVNSAETIAIIEPRPPPIQGSAAWRAVSHLALNYCPLLAMGKKGDARTVNKKNRDETTEEEDGAEALRELLRLYVDKGGAGNAQVNALKKASAEPVFGRVATAGPISHARGLRISLEFDEGQFKDTGMFLMGAVLNQFFSRYVSVNSFVQTELHAQPQKGDQPRKVFQWPPSQGVKQII